MLFAILLLPWSTLPLLALCGSGPRRLAPWLAGAAHVAALALLLAQGPAVGEGRVLLAELPWIPSLGLALSLRLDGLSFLFALLVLAIGVLVVLYAAYYLSAERRLGRFYGLLALFSGAMLGLVLSGNMLLSFAFWELTSLSSFLLVGYWYGKPAARDGARTALAVTAGGGLALLGAIVLLGDVAGSYRLSDVLAARDLVQTHPHYKLIVVLVLLAAFTKSAQVPFHFWLPGAMAAPTPVSAYLHSATLVKAGIFLLARFHPVLAGPSLWFYALTGVGLVTFVWGAYQAIFRHDLKGLLAYSTVSHLGLITLLFGIGTPLSAVAGLFHVVNHATFKASLFMAAGIIDHECGTRDMRRINGLWRYMPYTGLLAAVAAASMAGVPLVNGFLSKEMFFGEALDLQRGGGLQWILPVAAVAGGVFSVAYSLRFIHDVFFLRGPLDTPRVPHEPPRWMRIPVEVLVAVCVLIGLFPGVTVEGLLRMAAHAVVGDALPPFSLALWHGINLPLIMSALALGGGVLLYFLMQYGLDLHAYVSPRHTAKRAFDRMLLALAGFADRVAGRAWGTGMTGGITVTLAVALLAGLFPFLLAAGVPGLSRTTTADPLIVSMFSILCIAAVAMIFTHRHRLAAIIVLSVVGLAVALLFAFFSAPDLALTQLAVETVSLLLILLGLRHLPARSPPETALDHSVRDFLLACISGGAVGWLAWAMLTRPFASISDYFIRNSLPQGGGANVVNVILVDFRAFDTYGEITVIVIATLGIAAMLNATGRAERDGPASSAPARADMLPLDLIVRLLLPLALLVSAHLFLRGHNQPGGGFVAGLVAAIALVTLELAGVQSALGMLNHTRLLRLAMAGLLIAAATGLAAVVAGAPFLTSAHGRLDLPLVGGIPLSSAMLFDLGVYLVVMSAALLILGMLARMPAGESRR